MEGKKRKKRKKRNRMGEGSTMVGGDKKVATP
jgi:hypothetical protein